VKELLQRCNAGTLHMSD